LPLRCRSLRRPPAFRFARFSSSLGSSSPSSPDSLRLSQRLLRLLRCVIGQLYTVCHRSSRPAAAIAPAAASCLPPPSQNRLFARLVARYSLLFFSQRLPFQSRATGYSSLLFSQFLRGFAAHMLAVGRLALVFHIHQLRRPAREEALSSLSVQSFSLICFFRIISHLLLSLSYLIHSHHLSLPFLHRFLHRVHYSSMVNSLHAS